MISVARPKGHVNNWPIADYDAFVALVESAETRMTELGEDDLTAVHGAAAEMGLERGHWLVRETLAGVYGRFDLGHDGDWYAESAVAFFRVAGTDAMILHGPEGLPWARKLAAQEREYRSKSGPSLETGHDNPRQDGE